MTDRHDCMKNGTVGHAADTSVHDIDGAACQADMIGTLTAVFVSNTNDIALHL